MAGVGWVVSSLCVLLSHAEHSAERWAGGIMQQLQTQPQGGLSRAEDLPLLCHVWETPIPHSQAGKSHMHSSVIIKLKSR